jgi:putative ABC transport system permease protein
MAISALNRKLLRDLLGMKGQALAIALVVAAGVAMFVMYLSNFDSLRGTQRAYYERQRFADVFVSVKRAPLRLEERIAALPGVAQVETRVVVDVTLDVPGLDEPGTGRLVSVRPEARPRVNDVYLRAGRWVEAGRPDEVLASEAFCEANGLTIGDSVGPSSTGAGGACASSASRCRRSSSTASRPARSSPTTGASASSGWSAARWRARSTWTARSTTRCSPWCPARGRRDRGGLDRLLEPYGTLGAIPRALQFSHWTLESELTQLQSFGFVIPLIFLAVAAFILNVALTRALALQRPQIAALKALGYDNARSGGTT